MNNFPTLQRIFIIFCITAGFYSCQKEQDYPHLQEQSNYFVSSKLAVTLAEDITMTVKGSQKAKGNPLKQIKEFFPVINQESDTVFYIINYDPEGFIILAADKRSIPILGFSSTGSFQTDVDNLPLGLGKWLEKTRNDINQIRDKTLVQKPEIENKWKNLSHEKYSPFEIGDDPQGIIPIPPPGSGCESYHYQTGPLLSTEWHQGCGFNNAMPPKFCADACDANNKSFAGCVPIAIAQVMKYYEHPSSYNWTNMPLEVGTTTTASLIRDIWNNIPSSQKSYDCKGTGVDPDYNVAYLLKNDFNYSSGNTADYNRDTVIEQLSLDQPVILSGGSRGTFGSYNDGHMWVCDGYKSSYICTDIGGFGYLYLHMNWGWGGNWNGWYGFNDFTPGNLSFNYAVEMVYNIVP